MIPGILNGVQTTLGLAGLAEAVAAMVWLIDLIVFGTVFVLLVCSLFFVPRTLMVSVGVLLIAHGWLLTPWMRFNAFGLINHPDPDVARWAGSDALSGIIWTIIVALAIARVAGWYYFRWSDARWAARSSGMWDLQHGPLG